MDMDREEQWRKSLGTMVDAAADKIGQADRVLSAVYKLKPEEGAILWDCQWKDGRLYGEVIGDALTAAQVTVYGLLGAIERLIAQIKATED